MIDPSSWASSSTPDHILSDNSESRSWPQHFWQCWIYWILASDFLRETIVLPCFTIMATWQGNLTSTQARSTAWSQSKRFNLFVHNSGAQTIIAEKTDGASSFHMVTRACAMNQRLRHSSSWLQAVFICQCCWQTHICANSPRASSAHCVTLVQVHTCAFDTIKALTPKRHGTTALSDAKPTSLSGCCSTMGWKWIDGGVSIYTSTD